MNWFFSKLRPNFHWQITALIAVGIIALAIVASLSAGWILKQKMTELLKQQGEQITSSLAHQSILPLLSGVKSSAADDVDSILAFTYVQSASIYSRSGEVLVSSGTYAPEPIQVDDKRFEVPFSPVLVKEERDHWVFNASVYNMDVFDPETVSIDALFVQTPNLIGFVSVTLDRRSLHAIQRSLIIDNLGVSIAVAIAFILLGFLIVKALIRPLYQLASLMKRAEDGEDDIRANLSGSDEIQHMGRAFNTMMTALENRRVYAEQQHESLLKEIHEREAVEIALRNSEMHFRTVFENVVDGILIANNQGLIESANPAAKRLLGKPYNQILERGIAGLLFPEDSRRLEQTNLRQPEEPIFIHSIGINKEPLELSVKFSQMVVKGELKQIAILHDISESQLQNKRIEALLAQHEAIVSSIPGIIVEIDAQGRFTWWNKRTEEVTGCESQELKIRGLADFIDEDEPGEIDVAIKQSFVDGKVELHANLVTPQGNIPYQFNGLVIPSPSQKSSSTTLLIVGTDDSESIRTQLALQQARDVALETARVKSEFLANMSHEIRTPMNGMMGMLQLIGDSALNEEQRSYLDIALRSSDQLLNIINDILDFSKIEAGKMEINHQEFSPRILVEDAVELFAKKAHEKGLRIYSDISMDVPNVALGDPQRLTQVLSNLIGNAIKFTEEGSVLVDLHMAEDESAKPVFNLSVVDTGVGVDEEVQAKVFESFAQIDGSSTRRYSGTGLGLAIVKQLVGLMNGRLLLESAPGEGSSFQVKLPAECVGEEPGKECQVDTASIAYV